MAGTGKVVIPEARLCCLSIHFCIAVVVAAADAVVVFVVVVVVVVTCCCCCFVKLLLFCQVFIPGRYMYMCFPSHSHRC